MVTTIASRSSEPTRSSEPPKVGKIGVADGSLQLHLDRDHAVSSLLFDDQIDLVLAALSASVFHSRLDGLCVHTNVEGDE